VDRQLESLVSTMLEQRDGGSTLCPSEPARALWPERWRSRMPEVHAAIRRMAAQGAVEVLQRGRVVDAARVRGPFRVRGSMR